MIEIQNGLPQKCGSPFFIHIFEENISQAKPISHAVRRISQLCIAKLSLSKNIFFDKLTEVKEASKTSKREASAYIGTLVLPFAQ